ncbi:MAG: transcriptional regulator, MerR family, partial [uncultured Actinomycetospora sp.]
ERWRGRRTRRPRARAPRPRGRAGFPVRRPGLRRRDPGDGRGRRLPRAGRVPDRRHHLPPARLLGAHEARGAEHPHRHRFGLAAAVLVQGPRGAQGGQEPPRHRRLAEQHPPRRRAAAPPRRARPRAHHPVLRRRHRLRVHLARGGRRPAPGRPGRLRHRRRRGHARDLRDHRAVPGRARRLRSGRPLPGGRARVPACPGDPLRGM